MARRRLSGRKLRGESWTRPPLGRWQARVSSGPARPRSCGCARPCAALVPLLLSRGRSLSDSHTSLFTWFSVLCSFGLKKKWSSSSEYSCSGAAMDIFLTSSCKSLLSFYPSVYVCVFPKTYMHVCIFFSSSYLSHFS